MLLIYSVTDWQCDLPHFVCAKPEENYLPTYSSNIIINYKRRKKKNQKTRYEYNIIYYQIKSLFKNVKLNNIIVCS